MHLCARRMRIPSNAKSPETISNLAIFIEKISKKLHFNSQNALSTEAAGAAAGSSMSTLAELQGK